MKNIETVKVTARPGLRSDALGLVDCIGQSVANIGPTLTPALNIAVVAGLAGDGSWFSYLIATVGMLFVAFNIATLSRRHTLSGSYFLYIGRTAGPLAGLVSGWLMIGAYLMTAMAVIFSFLVFLRHFLESLGLGGHAPNEYAVVCLLVLGTGAAAYRDVGVGDVTFCCYPEARHEVFNETNRDEVTADLLAWLAARP